MDIDHALEQIRCMSPSSFSTREQLRYRAEKMLMRQFLLMKLQHQVPAYLCADVMKRWLLRGRSFLEEFQELEHVADARKLLMVELAWTSARRLCVNQMEQELCEELEKEKHLSVRFRRTVTLEGLQMFLSVFCPKAERDIQTFLRHLSNKLLTSFSGCHTSQRSKLALLVKLQHTTAPLVPQLLDAALNFLLDDGDAGVTASSLTDRAEAASTHTGKQLADAVATCFCLNTNHTRARLLLICTSVSWDMVRAVYKRFDECSNTFRLMDFDESFITAREAVVCAIKDMDDEAQSAADNWTLKELEKSPETKGQRGAEKECVPSSVERGET